MISTMLWIFYTQILIQRPNEYDSSKYDSPKIPKKDIYNMFLKIQNKIIIPWLTIFSLDLFCFLQLFPPHNRAHMQHLVFFLHRAPIFYREPIHLTRECTFVSRYNVQSILKEVIISVGRDVFIRIFKQ